MRRFIKPVLVTVGAAAAAFLVANPGAPINPTPAAKAKFITACPTPSANKVKAKVVTLPTLPSITLPSLPSVTLPCIPVPSLPAITLPTLPTVTLPTVTLPPVTLPNPLIPAIPEIGFPGFPAPDDPCSLGQQVEAC